ncbi:hypothetical protein RN001_012303 [Aquatica leii]|uniref:Palmitoyltransferase n=1 Tax=Aquatica leii TaxID=1421715 RepID=A0AAN7S7Q3_9COLE|nr:hypothetical protein RN001_012303 [Aquatica leii]
MTSLTTLLLIFEFLVVPFLEILIHENVILILIVIVCFICVRISRARTARFQHLDSEVGDRGKTQNHCSLCNVTVPEKDYHCFWIDTCVGSHNRRLTLLAAALAIISLLYNANLTLTTVCHPFVIYKTILLPDDCSEVYEQFEYSLCFSAAVYSMCIAVLITFLFIYRILLISFKTFRLDTICIKLSAIVPTACHHWINRCCYRASYQRTIEQY